MEMTQKEKEWLANMVNETSYYMMLLVLKGETNECLVSMVKPLFDGTEDNDLLVGNCCAKMYAESGGISVLKKIEFALKQYKIILNDDNAINKWIKERVVNVN